MTSSKVHKIEIEPNPSLIMTIESERDEYISAVSCIIGEMNSFDVVDSALFNEARNIIALTFKDNIDESAIKKLFKPLFSEAFGQFKYVGLIVI